MTVLLLSVESPPAPSGGFGQRSSYGELETARSGRAPVPPPVCTASNQSLVLSSARPALRNTPAIVVGPTCLSSTLGRACAHAQLKVGLRWHKWSESKVDESRKAEGTSGVGGGLVAHQTLVQVFSQRAPISASLLMGRQSSKAQFFSHIFLGSIFDTFKKH